MGAVGAGLERLQTNLKWVAEDMGVALLGTTPNRCNFHNESVMEVKTVTTWPVGYSWMAY